MWCFCTAAATIKLKTRGVEPTLRLNPSCHCLFLYVGIFHNQFFLAAFHHIAFHFHVFCITHQDAALAAGARHNLIVFNRDVVVQPDAINGFCHNVNVDACTVIAAACAAVYNLVAAYHHIFAVPALFLVVLAAKCHGSQCYSHKRVVFDDRAGCGLDEHTACHVTPVEAVFKHHLWHERGVDEVIIAEIGG